MRIDALITSPTFVIARSHRAPPPHPTLVHVDAYRLDGRLELDDLDLDTDLARSAVVIEWGAGLAEELADSYLLIVLDRLPDDARMATITPVGGNWAHRVQRLLSGLQMRG
jgi:tRNA threonylcarbamoyladenosine biosynthesis protein TsaE